MVVPAIVLDAAPLGLLAHTRPSAIVLACRQWQAALIAAGRRIIVPEITDYEVRRELIRLRRPRAVARLDGLALQLEYLPLTTDAMHLAAELWAQARQQGQPTAPDHALDGDVLLAAQALSLGVPVVVATTNVGHVARFVPAELWPNIKP